MSPESFGGIIADAPDIPVSFTSTAATSASLISLSWSQGPTYYGLPVVDYGISYDEGQGDSTVTLLAAGITDTTYSYSQVTQGTTYVFYIQARSEFSYSEYSTPISVLAAEKPAKPATPTTSIDGDNVLIDWTAPDNMGSAITGYIIEVMHSDG